MTDLQKILMHRLGLMILLVAAVYGTTLNHGFVWDDTDIIVNNPLLENLRNIPYFFISEDTIDADPTGYYRPVTYISFALERAIWGVNPAGYHFTNLALHLLVILLFQKVITALFKKERLAFIAALIFALHPVAGETVNFLAGGRNTLLSASFALLSLLCYIKRKTIPAVASFTVAIFAKEFALLLPMVFLLYDYRLRREKIRYSGYLLYLTPIVCYLTLRSFAVKKANFLSGINLSEIATAPYLVVRYALNMIFPLQLKVLYDFKLSMVVSMICLVVLVVMVTVIYIFRKDDEQLFSACWFLIFLLPVINIIPLHTTSLMADRYAYFSLMGFALFLAALICRGNGRGVTVAVVTLCAIYVFIDVSRNRLWENDIKFFTRMTIDAPGKYTGFNNLGVRYFKRGEIEPAVNYLVAADSKSDIPFRYLMWGAYVFWKENLPDKAEKSFLRALDMEPGNPEPYLALMIIYEQKGNRVLAQAYRDKAKELVPRIDEEVRNRTVSFCSAGEVNIAKHLYINAEFFLWQALQFSPEFIPALIDMGSMRAEQGDYVNAIQYLNKALAIDPMNAPAHYNLSMVYQMQGRTAEAQAEMIKFREAEAVTKQKGGLSKP